MTPAPFTHIKNLDTGAILPWSPGFANYKSLNFEPYHGPLPGADNAEASPLTAQDGGSAATIADLQRQLAQMRELLAGAPVPTVSADLEMPAEKRLDAIKQAIAKVDPTSYGKAGFGFPAMPKVGDIEAITGFGDVTREDISAALAEMQ